MIRIGVRHRKGSHEAAVLTDAHQTYFGENLATRDWQIKLFRPPRPQNHRKSLAVLKWTVLEAQEELGRVLGHS